MMLKAGSLFGEHIFAKNGLMATDIEHFQMIEFVCKDIYERHCKDMKELGATIEKVTIEGAVTYTFIVMNNGHISSAHFKMSQAIVAICLLFWEGIECEIGQQCLYTDSKLSCEMGWELLSAAPNDQVVLFDPANNIVKKIQAHRVIGLSPLL